MVIPICFNNNTHADMAGDFVSSLRCLEFKTDKSAEV